MKRRNESVVSRLRQKVTEDRAKESKQELAAEGEVTPEQKYIKARNQLVRDFGHIAATPEGKNVLRHIMNVCGFHTPSLVLDSNGDIALNSVINNEARRNVWLCSIRTMIPRDALILIEYPHPELED